MKLGIRATRGALWTFLERGGLELINFVFFLALARLLEPADFGVMAVGAALVALVEIAMRSWVNVPIIQTPKLSDSHLDTAFWINLALATFMFLVVVAAAEHIAALFGQPQLRGVVLWLAPVLILRALVIVQVAYLNRQMRFRVLTIRALAGGIGGGAVAIILALSGHGVASLVGRELTAAVVTAVLLWVSCDWRPRGRVSRESFREMFATGKHLLASGFVAYLSRRLATPFVSYLMGPHAAGLFNAANRTSAAFASINEFMIGRVALPAYSKIQDDPLRLMRAFQMSLQLSNVVSFPIFVGLSSVAPELTHALLGAKWEEAIPLIQIVVLGGAARSFHGCGVSLLLSRAKADWLFYQNVAVTSLFLGSLPLVAGYGMRAIAILFVAQAYLRAVSGLFLIRRAAGYSLRSFARPTIVPLLACAVMYVAVTYGRAFTLDLHPLPALLTLVGVGLVTYLVAMSILSFSSLKLLFDYTREALLWRQSTPTGKIDH